MSKVIACMLSYKVPELTDRTVRHLTAGGFQRGEDLFIFENQGGPEHGGHLVLGQDCSQNVTHFTGSNLRMTGGFNYICETVAKWPDHEQPDYIWLCTNDFEVLESNGQLLKLILMNDRSTWWHPSLEPISGYAYPWMFQVTGNGRRPVKMTDFICPKISWQFLKNLRASRGYFFDPSFYRGWGIDYETCYLIRRVGGTVAVDDAVKVRHVASKTYTSGAAPESKDAFYSEALKEMRTVMRQKYGANWERLML